MTAGCKQSQEALLAVLLAFTVMETFIPEGAAALDTAETLWMPVLVQSSDHFIQYGLVAVCAVRGEEGEVVGLAVRSSIFFKKVTAAQLRLALAAHKMLRVPHLSQSRHHLSHHRLLTSRAVSLGGGLDSLTAQVGLEESQHAVQ